MKRIKFNRADIDSAIAAAKKIAKIKTCYVYATYCGYAISYAPVLSQKYYKVTAEGVELLGGLKNDN